MFFPIAGVAGDIPLFEGGLWAIDTSFASEMRGSLFPASVSTGDIPLLEGGFEGGIIGRLRAIETPFALAFAEKTPIVWNFPSLMTQWE
jgi:hypothetical protein